MRRAGNITAVAFLAIYALNRFVAPLTFVVPADFARFHLGDLCGGVVFPAYANLLCQLGGTKPIISDVCSSLAASLICACCWEVVAPALLPWSTGDLVDALMYLIGGLIYLAAYKSEKL